MKSFKEYWNEHGDVYAMEIAEDAWDYQQSKVDELQEELNEYKSVAENLDEIYIREKQKNNELQKRVDKAIRLLVEAELYQSELNIDLAVQALKGGGGELFGEIVCGGL